MHKTHANILIPTMQDECGEYESKANCSTGMRCIQSYHPMAYKDVRLGSKCSTEEVELPSGRRCSKSSRRCIWKERASLGHTPLEDDRIGNRNFFVDTRRCVRKHHQEELKRTQKHGQNSHVMLLCGADLIDTFSRILDNGQPLWTPEHVEEIIRDFGIVAINRIGATAMETLSKLKLPLSPEQMTNVILVDDFEKEDVSSTMVRQRVKQGQPITDLTFEKVVNYIRDNHLYEATT
ncbi:cytidylyltransferase-like domain-containing protein [Ditylenchus destructor]|nr:cytidylyltransferase-like domain-containing protein [Ditylenchus destructor]